MCSYLPCPALSWRLHLHVCVATDDDDIFNFKPKKDAAAAKPALPAGADPNDPFAMSDVAPLAVAAADAKKPDDWQSFDGKDGKKKELGAHVCLVLKYETNVCLGGQLLSCVVAASCKDAIVHLCQLSLVIQDSRTTLSVPVPLRLPRRRPSCRPSPCCA